jgi:hypothetical protein
MGPAKNIMITDFWRHLPPESSRDNPKSVAQFVLEQFARVQGFVFTFHHSHSLTDVAKNRPIDLANCKVLDYKCSQRLRSNKPPSQLPYGQTRNRETKVLLVDCKGHISVIMPPADRPSAFDIALDFQHELHHGREYYGVPLRVRNWIKTNARQTAGMTRDALLNALSRGEIPGVTDTFLSVQNVNYWWRKLYREAKYNNADPWVNAFQILEDHQLVFSKRMFWLIF